MCIVECVWKWMLEKRKTLYCKLGLTALNVDKTYTTMFELRHMVSKGCLTFRFLFTARITELWSLSASKHWSHLHFLSYASHIQTKTQIFFFHLTNLWPFCMTVKNLSVAIALFTFYFNILISPKHTPCTPHEQKKVREEPRTATNQ